MMKCEKNTLKTNINYESIPRHEHCTGISLETSRSEVCKSEFLYLKRKGIEKVLSSGSFYTLTYLIENHLKKNGLEKDTRILELRRILTGLILEFTITDDLDWIAGIEDLRFVDLEDSYQYQAALSSNCDLFLTLNERDFKKVKQSPLQICVPSAFLIQYNIDN